MNYSLKIILLVTIALVLLSISVLADGGTSTDKVTADQSDQPVTIQSGEKADPDSPPTCCRYRRGNVNDDPDDIVDIADLNYLIDYAFKGGPAPPCMEEADIDGDGSIFIVTDLNYLVDYMFNSGPEPPICPK